MNNLSLGLLDLQMSTGDLAQQNERKENDRKAKPRFSELAFQMVKGKYAKENTCMHGNLLRVSQIYLLEQ